MNKKLCILILVLWNWLGNVGAQVFIGSCGENVDYELNMSTGVLTLTGKGEINSTPWADMYMGTNGNTLSISNVHNMIANERTWNDVIRTVNIEEGITNIPDEIFINCRYLSSVTLPESIETIGQYAFSNCGFKQIILPKNLKSIGEGAFFGCL